MKNRFCLWLILLGSLCLSPRLYAQGKPLAELEREVKTILANRDNVEQRKLVAPVFELAGRYTRQDKVTEAMELYRKGLVINPWDLDAQLELAKLLEGTGDATGAKEKAELVWKFAETDALLAQAAKFIGKDFTAKLPDEELPAKTNVLVLVPYSNPEGWLVKEMRAGLQEILGIPVVIQKASFQIPEPSRDPIHERAKQHREKLIEIKNDKKFAAEYRKLGLHKNSLETDEQVFDAMRVLIKAEYEGRQEIETLGFFNNELDFLRRLGPQWDAGLIAKQLGEAKAARAGSGVGYLGITELDIYSDKSRYVFGVGIIGANKGVISVRRYLAEVNQEPPNKERLKNRSLKQALSTIGLLYGLPRCTNPTCTRAYVNSLQEHDAKELKLCAECDKGFKQRFGQQLK